ncbi:MAG: hypothetical protein HQM08_10435 [Candidatus Riflebacteria bacterium]|nr:hypothetical protein [Candidatus Riflebacteria bacterium]
MNELKKIFFLTENGLKGYLINSDGSFSEIQSTLPDEDSIFALPSSGALPFEVEIPFDDIEKGKIILPEMLRDIFSSFTDSWKVAWDYVQEAGKKIRISGLAYPDLMIGKLVESHAWRMAIPECYLIPDFERGFLLESPSGKMECRTDGGLRRFFFGGRGIPVFKEETANFEKISFLDAGKLVWTELEKIEENPRNLDVSCWLDRRKIKIQNYLKNSLIFLLLLIFFLWNLFLFFEEKGLSEQRKKISQKMREAFQAAFPNEKAVEPLLQSQKLVKDLEESARSISVPPVVDFSRFFNDISKFFAGRGSINKAMISPTSWNISGETTNYRILEEIVNSWNQKSIFSGAKYTNAKPVSRPGGGERLVFTIEGLLK